jgi:hypothetical protein
MDLHAGYWAAWQKQILHRDISIRNIMLIDEHPFAGFLHDFDYSINMNNDGSAKASVVESSLKDMTVSNL